MSKISENIKNLRLSNNMTQENLPKNFLLQGRPFLVGKTENPNQISILFLIFPTYLILISLFY